MSENKSRKEYRIYKPSKNNSGSVSSWQVSLDSNPEKGNNVFLDCANQKQSENDNAAFDWDNKVTVKLGLPDLGAILSVLNGRQDDIVS